MIIIEFLSIKVIKPRAPYSYRPRYRRLKPGAHPFDLLYLVVGKMVGASLRPVYNLFWSTVGSMFGSRRLVETWSSKG